MRNNECQAACFTTFIILHSSFSISSEPLDEAADAFFNRRLWVVAEKPFRLRDVGEGLRHVAGLQGLALNHGVTAQLMFEQADQFSKLDRARLAEVDDLVAARLVIP